MANFSTNQFKAGLKIMLDGEPCNILENELVKPGKGQAFNRVKIRKLVSGKVLTEWYGSLHGPQQFFWHAYVLFKSINLFAL